LTAGGVRVRFAPSPTGYLHVGGARTALFNWLFARHHGGAFVLRVEDTDVARNRPEYVNAIYEGLRWLGLEWDEGPDRGGPYAPYLQSLRAERHREVARVLHERGAAYECFCSQRPADDNEDEDEAQQPPAGAPARAEGPKQAAAAPRPVCECRTLDPDRLAALREERTPALRLRVPPGRDFVVEDLVRGRVTFPGSMVEDFVLVTGDGRALYNLAAGVDDHDMAISHVIRGEEHLANTPKQQLIYEAMGWQPPQYAHLPIILNQQRRKLSKRDGATSLNEYAAMGYVPDAVVNFLALLGWSPGDNREILSRDELIRLFDLGGVVKHPAIFDTAKLNWMNREYIKARPAAELARRMRELLAQRPQDGQLAAPARDDAYIEKVAELFHDRVRTVVEVFELGSYFFTDDPVVPSPEALAKYCTGPEVVERLREVRAALAGAAAFDAATVEKVIRDLAAERGCKASDYIHPLRVAVTGQAVSPGIFHVLAILGKERVLRRIDALVHLLDARPAARTTAP
jgi:nondiscriminating glutamyl-tRNA synthetase